MKTVRGATWRGPRTRGAFHAALALTLLSVGCTSNRFRFSNDPRIDRNAELAVIDSRTRQVPVAPGEIPAVPAIAAAETGHLEVAQDAPRPGESGVPAATYPPRSVSPPYSEPDPDAALVRDGRSSEAGLNSRTRDENPRPGPPGTLVSPPVAGPQIVGRVVNPYGRPEPNASIQVYDLSENRRLVAETASGPDGRFRAQNLEPGRQYEIAAGVSTSGVRYFGTVVAVPPESSAVIRLEPENKPRGSSTSAIERIPGAKALQGLVSRPDREPQPTSDNVRISAPKLTAASRTLAPVQESALINAVAQERTVESAPVKLPTVGERPRESAAIAPKAAAPVYQPPKQTGVTGKLTFPIIYRDGTPGVIEQIPGEIILIDFWGTWCGPCKRAVPHLNALHQKYSARGLHIVGAAAEHGNRGEQLQRLAKARRELDIQYTAVLCPGGLGEACPLRSAFNVASFPTFVLIDRGGRILFTGQGGNEETLARVDRAIGNHLSSVGR